MVDEIVRPFLANFFLNNKLLEAFVASETLEEVVLVLLVKVPSGKKVSVPDTLFDVLCCVVILGVNLKEKFSVTF